MVVQGYRLLNHSRTLLKHSFSAVAYPHDALRDLPSTLAEWRYYFFSLSLPPQQCSVAVRFHVFVALFASFRIAIGHLCSCECHCETVHGDCARYGGFLDCFDMQLKAEYLVRSILSSYQLLVSAFRHFLGSI